MATTNKNFRVKNGLDVNGEINASAVGGDEGGQINLQKPATGTTLSGNVSIDVYQNKIRIFDSGGTARGAYIDLSAAAEGVGSNLLDGGSGTASDSFKTISANGTSVVADSSTDTLTITPGDGLSIAGNATSDTITFTPNVAGASANGIVTTGTQTFAGEKTFSNNITASANIVANTGFVSADTFRLDTSYTGGSAVVGEFSWDPDFETARLLLDGVNLQIGQEHVVRVKNASGSVAIPDRTLVMFAGSTGDTVTVSPANSSNIATNPSDRIVGITTEEIAADGFGFVTQFGFINQVNTAAWTVGTLLYSDPATPGGFVTSRPAAPSWSMPIAAVTRQHATTGRIFVRALPGQELEEIDNVQITSVADNEFLAYNSANGTWINQTAEEAGIANLSGATFTGNIAGTNLGLSGKNIFSNTGTGAPTFTTYSSGVRTVFYDNINGTSVGYSRGIDAGVLWDSIPAADAGMFFKWYGGQTQVASLSGAGVFTATTIVGNTNASTITTGTIDNARTSANAANGASTIVARDATGNFTTNTITATTFTGNLSATTATVSGTINANAITVAQQKNAAVVSGYNSASGSFAHASKVIMSANATASAAPTTRPDGTSLAAGDVWISW